MYSFHVEYLKNKQINKEMNKYLIILFLTTITQLFSQSTEKYNTDYASFYRAEELYNKEQYGAARNEFRAFINQFDKKNDPLYIQAMYYEGLSALELYHNDAVDLLINFNKNYPESIYHNAIFFRLGKYYYQKKDYSETLVWLNQLKVTDVEESDRSEFYFKIGYSNFQIHKFVEARNAFFEIKGDSSQYSNPALYYYSHIAYQDKSYQTALEGFLKLQNDTRFSRVVPYYIMQIYHTQKKYKEVTEYAPNVLDTSNIVNINDINHILGDAYYKTGFYDEAVLFLEKYNKESKTTRDDDYELAYAYFQSENYVEAIKYFDKVTEQRDSLSQVAYYQIGESYLKLEKLAPARAAFNEASLINLNPKIQKDALYNYAVLSYKLDINPYDEAVEALQLYLNKYPDSERKNDIYQYLVNVYTTTNKFGKALQSLDKLQNKDIRLKTAYQIVAYNYAVELYQKNNYEDAVKTFELVDKFPIDATISANAKFWEADAQFQLKKYDKAIQGYRAYINSQGITDITIKADAYYNIGYAYYAKNDTSQGVENFRIYTQTINLSNTKNKAKLVDAYMRAGDGYYILKENENAEKFYKGAYDFKSGNEDQALFYLAKTYTVIKGKNEAKINALQDIINNYSGSKYTLSAINELAITYKFLEKYDLSLRYFQLIATDYPSSILVKSVKVEIADLYLKKLDYVKSERAFKELLDEYGSDREICERGAKGLIELYSLQKKFELAEETGNKYPCAGVTKDQQERELYYLPAMMVYNDTTKTLAAIESFEKYLTKYPAGIYVNEVRNHLADCYYRTKNIPKAVEIYIETLKETTNGYTELAAIRVSKYLFNSEKYEEAIPYYARLESISSTPIIIFNSRLGLMKSHFIIEDWTKAAEYAKIVLENSQLNNTNRLDAEYVKALANYNIANYTEAKPSLEWIVKNSTNEKASEAKFTIAEMYYKLKELEKSEIEVRALLKMKPTYNYWVAKGLILQAKTLILKNDLFQAEQTLKSVKEHYQINDDGIMVEANEVWDELMQLKNKPKNIQESGTTEIEVNEGGN
ncbi:MAG: tetratricopeptide repeat protein [Flavobacteriia bacterium]|nr:tetratricopeptide repeat protein [Flavobacteriia bacterium]